MTYKNNCDCQWCMIQRWKNYSILKRIWISYKIWWNRVINKFNSDYIDYVYGDYLKENDKK